MNLNQRQEFGICVCERRGDRGRDSFTVCRRIPGTYVLPRGKTLTAAVYPYKDDTNRSSPALQFVNDLLTKNSNCDKYCPLTLK